MSRKRIAASVVSILLAAPCAHAAGPVREFLSNEKAIWTAPLHIGSSEAEWLAVFGAGTAALIASDVRVSRELSGSPSQLRWGTRLSRTGSAYGVLAVSTGLMATGALTRNSRLQRTGRKSAEAALHAFVLTYGLKLAAARERPNTGSGRGEFWSGYREALKADTSFPSGHSMGAWAAASVIGHEYAGHPLVQCAAYGYASMVSISRVAAQRHYAGDVVAGAGAGFLLGRFLQRPARTGPATHRRGAIRASIRPRIDLARRAAGLDWSW